jgi:hypothetical protein
MKADQRKQLEKNELVDRLTHWWKGTGEARTSQTFWVALGAIVLVAVLYFAWRYYSDTTQKNRAAVWKQIEEATTADELQTIAEANRGTTVGRAAKAQLARLTLNQGLGNLPTDVKRSKAIGDVERARELYRELTTESKGDALLQRESMLASAKAEEALVGIPKSDAPSESRGSLDKALELYEQTAQQFAESPQGKDAAERAKEIRENKQKIQQFYEDLNKHYVRSESAGSPFEPGGTSSLVPNEPAPKVNDKKPEDKKPAEPQTPLAPPPGSDKKPEKKPEEPGTKPLPPLEKPKDTKPADPKPGEPKPAPPPLAPPPKDPAQPMPKPGEKSGEKPGEKPGEKKPEKP